MERQVEKYIHNLPDIDLLVYTKTETHLPEALEFARIELADRHFTADHLAELEEQLRQRQIEQEQEVRIVAAEPLSLEWRIAVFLSGLYCGILLVFFYPAWQKFREQGADKKFKDMWVYALVGFCLQPILIFLGISPWNWLADLF
jgi:predicted nucleotidyltransferase